MAAHSPEPQGSEVGASHAVSRREPGRLSQRERARLAAEILVAYAQARRALRHAPIAAALESLRGRPATAPALCADPLEESVRLGRAVTRLLRLLPGDTRCLARSLVLTRLLAARGIEAKLVIGARTSPEFLAHAWVEYRGAAVLDPGDETFGRLAEL